MTSKLGWDIPTIHVEFVKQNLYTVRKTYAMREKRSFTTNIRLNDIIQVDNRRVTIHEDIRFYDSYRILAISANDLSSVYTDPTFVKLDLCEHVDDYSPIQHLNEQQKKSKFKTLLKKKFKKKTDRNAYISAPFDPLKRCVSDLSLTVPARSDFFTKLYEADTFEPEKTEEMKKAIEEPFYESVRVSPLLRSGDKYSLASDNSKVPPSLPERNASTFYIDKPDGSKGYEIMKSQDDIYTSKEDVDDSYETVSVCSIGSNPYERVDHDRTSMGSRSSQERLSLHSRSGNGYEDMARSRPNSTFDESYDNLPRDNNYAYPNLHNESEPKYSDLDVIKSSMNELNYAQVTPIPALRPTRTSRAEAVPQSRELVTLKSRDNRPIRDSLNEEDSAPYALVGDINRRRSSTPVNSIKHTYTRKQQLSLHLKYDSNVYSNCSPQSSRGTSPDYENSRIGSTNKLFDLEDSIYENRLPSENDKSNQNGHHKRNIPDDDCSNYENRTFDNSSLKPKLHSDSGYENNVLRPPAERTVSPENLDSPEYESVQTIYGNLEQPLPSTSRSKSLKYIDVILDNKSDKKFVAEQTDSSQYNYIKIDFEKSKCVNEAIKDLRLTQQNTDIKGDYLTDLSHRKFTKKPTKKT